MNLLTKVVLMAGLSVGIAGFVSAQGMHGAQGHVSAGQQSGHGMMNMMHTMHSGGGMMGEMMHGGRGMMGGMGASNFVPTVKTILSQSGKLSLTDEQTRTLKQQYTAMKKQVIRLRADNQVALLEYREVLQQPNSSQKEVTQALQNVNQQREALQELRLDSYFTARDELTQEQRDQLSTFTSGCMMGMGMHRGTGDSDTGNSGHMPGMMHQGTREQ